MPTLTLDSGCSVTVEAIDPSTGATVTGVTVSKVAFYGLNEVPDFGPIDPSADETLPVFVPVPDTEDDPVAA